MADLDIARREPAAGDRSSDLVPIEPPPSELIPPAPGEDEVMSLVDHLAELRRRLAISVLAIVAGTILGFIVAPRVIEFLKQPIGDRVLQVLEVGGLFFLYLKIAILIGVLLAMPLILYQVWAFVSPGLTADERRVARPWVPLAICFFALGVAVAYVVLPYATGFLLSWEQPGVVVNNPTAASYFDFVLLLFVAFGLVMQFPIVLVVLNRLGVLTVQRLRAGRRVALLAMVVFAVVVTPGGDPVSPVVMSGVMYLLYEGTIQLLARAERRDAARAVP